MARNTTTSKLLATCEPVITGAGYELVDIEYRREQHGWVVRVYIDRPERPGGVSFADCETISRELGPVLDVEDPVPQAYNLEVSSPGIERPLRTPDHFRARIGSVVKITLGKGVEGRRNFKGELVSAEPDSIVVDVDGTRFTLPVADIESAKLVPNWDDVLKQGS
jgi:ribosome maturation factor RimP